MLVQMNTQNQFWIQLHGYEIIQNEVIQHIFWKHEKWNQTSYVLESDKTTKC